MIKIIFPFAFYLIIALPAFAQNPGAPYPQSPVIAAVEWAPASEIIRLATGSDNWPCTWADDGALYTAYGDGFGFKPMIDEKLSLGVAKVTGNPPNIQGHNIRTESGEQYGDGNKGKKASGMLMVDDILYMWVRNADNSQLAWSNDHGKTWQWNEWKFETSFGAPTFLNYGKNYSGARDEYVYIVSHHNDSAYETASRMVMARVHKDRILERDAYEFFVEMDENKQPVWSEQIEDRGAVFQHENKCYRSGITYNAGLKRYFWCQTLLGDGSPRFEGGFGIYDAPEPWGPWTTVFYTEKWDVGPGETSSIPTKWMSPDGQTAYLVFSGNDNFSVRQMNFKLK